MPSSRPDGIPALRDDPWLKPWLPDLDRRAEKISAMRRRLPQGRGTLAQFALGHLYYGLHATPDGGWVFREWAPNATSLYLIGDHSDWRERPQFAARRLNSHGDWELIFPPGELTHGDHYKLSIHWPGGRGERIPAWTRRAVQDYATHLFSAQVWESEPFTWQHDRPDSTRPPLIYEAHAGMAQEELRIGTWLEFRDHTLPRIQAAGYNTVQLMGVMEHPYYGSFGYHVSNFFAPSSRFGTPEEFKSLVDTAHGMGLSVIIDLVHSHSVKNELDGLANFDGTPWQYFHDGPRGQHPAWDSRCFNYSKPEVLHFLLSNCRYWVEEYQLDGFRFDGVTSMLYADHGLGKAFTQAEDYFNPGVDEDALTYLALANEVIHQVNPSAITIAEDVSGMPGLGASTAEGGSGFDYRLAMGVPDIWARLASKKRDEDWHVEHLYHELTTRRAEEKVIAYVESHDQAIVGGQTFISRLLGAAIYSEMGRHHASPATDRGLALWKIARILTLGTAGHGYLNFMGNEFGHPEWIDFPREGNGWSFHYARRQWSLRDNPDLKYHAMGDFDTSLMALFGTPDFLRAHPQLHASHLCRQHLAFQRGAFLIIASLNPAESFPDLPIPCPAGKWDLVLDTDERRFAGPGRIASGQSFFTTPEPHGGHSLSIYLPARSALILRHSP
jgi:1,4-alpha-glucan branching enzyme